MVAPTARQHADSAADGEVMLDIIEVAGAVVAPAANIAVYFLPEYGSGFPGWDNQTAIHDTPNKPTVLSIICGSPEVNWTEQSLNSFNDAFKTASVLGVTICVAAGDAGAQAIA